MSKHTPGSPGVRSRYDVKDREERKANARLISAVHDLLEACKEVHNKLSYPAMNINLFNELRDLLKQAISKAEGREGE